MADNPQIKKLKIGSTTYDIRDESVSGQISSAITALNLGTAAQANTSDFDAAGAASAAELAAKNYADGLVAKAINFQGTKDTIAAVKAITSAKKGDLWIALEDNSEWICKETISTATASAWEKLGTTDVTGALYKGNNTFTDGYILKADGTEGKVQAVQANGSAVGLGNVTNNKQVKGLSSGTTENHILVWGADGYTVKDSGKVVGDFDVSGAASTAELNAKNYADAEMAKLQADEAGAHTHTVSASGSITPNLSPTTKYLSASASGGSVALTGDKTFIKSLSLNTQNLVKSSIAVGGMVTDVTISPTRASQSGFTSSYDSTTCCLTLTPFSGYIVSDVGSTVTKNSSAITYATGAVGASGTGDAVGVSVTPTTATVGIGTMTQPSITLTVNDATATGRVTYVQSVAGASTSVNVSGTAASNGAHTHDVSKKSS